MVSEHSSKFVEEIGGEPTGYWEERRQRFWICAGCEAATLEVGWTHVGDHDPQSGKQVWSSKMIPERTKHKVSEKHFKQLPEKLDKIYRESAGAYNGDLPMLCATGLRSLIEGICKDKGIGKKRDNLKERINGLKSILPSHIVADLHSFRFMGNEAVHELSVPSEKELRLAIEVCEDLLNYLYELEYKTQLLSQTRSGNGSDT